MTPQEIKLKGKMNLCTLFGSYPWGGGKSFSSLVLDSLYSTEY